MSSAEQPASELRRLAVGFRVSQALHVAATLGVADLLAGAMADGSALLLVERELGPANDEPEAKFSDLNMLVGPGGRERTIAEYAVLLERAGLRLVGVVPTTAGLNVIEAEPG